MSIRTVVAAVAVAVVLLVGVAVPALRPTDPAAYRDAAVTAAQSSLSAVRTLVLAARADLAGRELPSHLGVVADTAREAVASASRDLALTDVPDTASARLRDEVRPLLEGAVVTVGETVRAVDTGDTAGVRAGADSLTGIGDGLQAFVRAHR